MAHEIDQTVNANGAAIFAREAAWHGLGTVLDHPFTSEEALQIAGLDFTVEKRTLYFESGASATPSTEWVATVRTDTEAQLGVVGPDYQPIQNREAFRAFDSILAKHGAVYETAGSLRGGKRIFIASKLPESFKVTGAPGDTIEEYLLAFNAHDGSGAIWMLPTNIRPVCANTVGAALGLGFSIARKKLAEGRALKVRHTANAEERLLGANAVFEAAHKRAAAAAENAKRLADLKATDQMVERAVTLTLDTFVGADILVGEDNIRAFEKRGEKRNAASRVILDQIEAEYALVGKNAWAVYNGNTEYADFGLRYRGVNAKENRFASIISGRVDDYKAELASALVA